MIIYRITIKHNIWQNSLAPDQNIPGTPLKKYQYKVPDELSIAGNSTCLQKKLYLKVLVLP